MEPSYLNDGPRLVECMLSKVKEEIREPNLGYLMDYAKELRTSGKDPRTIARHLRELGINYSKPYLYEECVKRNAGRTISLGSSFAYYV